MEPSETDLPGANITNEASSRADAIVPSPTLADFFAQNALTADRLAGNLVSFLEVVSTDNNIDSNQPLTFHANGPPPSSRLYVGLIHVLVPRQLYDTTMFVHRDDYSKTFSELFLENWPKSYGELIDRSDGPGKEFRWDIHRDLNQVRITYRAYSHDREDPLPRTIFELSTFGDGNIEPASEPVGRGKISILWYVDYSMLPHGTLSIQNIAYLLSSLRIWDEFANRDRGALWLLRAATRATPLSDSYLFIPSLQTWPDLSTMLSRPDMELGFRMAYLGALHLIHESSRKTGMLVDRATAKLSSLNEFHSVSAERFKIRVMVISALFSPTPDCPYQISAFMDYIGSTLSASSEHFDEMPQGSTWKTFGLRPCGSCAGVGQFLCLAMLFFVRWEKGWTDTLDEIDRSVSFELDDTLHEDKLDSLMFDESFRRSKLYFTILQLLRSSSNMVHETRREWIKLHEAWLKQVDVPGTLFSRDDLEAASWNWKVAKKAIDAASDRIDERITRKTEEIKSLRDGLFNATALREATNSIALNRAIYVFTVVTVIYTPIGFLAAFWALPFFQRPAESNGTNDQFLVPRGFTATFIVVPILTYLIAMLVAFSLGYSSAERRLFKERAFEYCRPIIDSHTRIMQKLQVGWEFCLDTLRNLRGRVQGSRV